MDFKEQELKQFASDLATDSNGWLAYFGVKEEE